MYLLYESDLHNHWQTDLTPPHFCSRYQSGPGFPTSYRDQRVKVKGDL